jgi:hypothetical protein
MIIGGINGAGKTHSMRTGYSSRFLPCRATVLNTSVLPVDVGSLKRPVQYVASARVRNLTDTAWVDLPTVTYFQVVRRMGTGLDTASVTVKKPEDWGIFGAQAGLLRPSERAFQIFAGIKVGSTEATLPLFFGRITSYSESHGGQGGSINLGLADIRDSMDRVAAASYSGSQTAYRAALREAQDNTVLYTIGDRIAVFSEGETSLSAITSRVTGIPALSVTGYGQLVIDEQSESTDTTYAFLYDDDSLISLTRDLDNGSSFNTAIAYGLDGTTPTTQEVSDAADVALRGKVRYAAGLIGTPTIAIADAVTAAESAIAQSLYGLIRAEMQFNPYLAPGMAIRVQSTRIGLPLSRCELQGLTHQYSVGSARTYINKAAVVPV